MSKVEIRPRLTISVPYGKQEIIRRLRNKLHGPDSEWRGNFVKPVVVLSVKAEDTHFWSPELGLEFEEGETGTVIRCVRAPRSGQCLRRFWEWRGSFSGSASGTSG